MDTLTGHRTIPTEPPGSARVDFSMSEERRYDDLEMAEILDRATSEQERRPLATPGEGGGLTLHELEQIGAEVGILPARIAEAARALDLSARAPVAERFMGATRSVSRTVQIERAMTDDEWGRLVADLRRTFNAQGKIESQGALRSWSNSNLQVHVEPDGAGYAVRMSTRKGNVTQLTLMGTLFLVDGRRHGDRRPDGTDGRQPPHGGLFCRGGFGRDRLGPSHASRLGCNTRGADGSPGGADSTAAERVTRG